MQLTIKIYKNTEQVNEIKSNDPAVIYKNLAQVLMAKENKRAIKTQIAQLPNNKIKVIQKFDQYKTQIPNTTYTYKYNFVDIVL